MLLNKQWKSEVNKVVGSNLKAFLKKSNIYQSKLALMLGVEKGFVHARFVGKSPMTAHDIVAIQKALGLSKAECKKFYSILFNNTNKIEVISRDKS
jgi:plasmid maintenance system antidote protein VapI